MNHAMQDTAASAAIVRDVGARRRRRVPWRFPAFAIALVALLFARPAERHARAAALLASFSDAKSVVHVGEEKTTFTTPDGRVVPARFYFPPHRAASEAPAVVMVHGVHDKGIEEPRLQRFARSVANIGIVVMTPEVEELSDYHVAPRSIDTVGAAVDVLRARTGASKVGVMGMSFGGGVALLTAADERFADRVAFVVAIGAHDDLARVSRFFATNEIPTASGGIKKLHAHDYGAMVLTYNHVAKFFPAEDVPAAGAALKHWLAEERDDARREAAKVSPESRARLEKLFAADVASIEDELLADVAASEADMAKVSPHGHLAGLRAHVYLLHGAGDTVIPATETEWLAKDVPSGTLREALVSPAIVHVELDKPTLGDQWDLVHFMGRIVDDAEATR